MAAASASEMIPCWASIRAWAREPSISCFAMRWSTSIEALIASITASGPLVKRPPHMLLVPSSAARKPVETLWFGQICMTNSYSASLHRRNLLRHMGAAGLGVALGSLSPLNAAWAQAQPPRTGRFAPGGDYLTAPPGLMAPDCVRLQSGLVQPLAFYDRDGGETFLSAYRGKVTLIQFWRTRCHGCQEEVLAPNHPRFQAKATPTTMLIGANGQVLGAYVGVAGWERPAGRALLNHYISQA